MCFCVRTSFSLLCVHVFFSQKKKKNEFDLGKERLIRNIFDLNGFKNKLGGVWFVILNNISRISMHFFTHTYFHKYFQTTIFSF